jgi:hypothetical protein
MEKGDKDKAKELLTTVRDRLSKPDESGSASAVSGPSFPYLSEMANDRLRELDPSAAPKPSHPGAGGGQMSPAELKRKLEEAMKKAGQGGK